MSMTDREPARRAALLVRSLDDRARASVLSSLSESEQSTLTALLFELDQLGLPPSFGANIVDEIEGESPSRPLDPQERVASLASAQVLAGLEGVSVKAVICLLGAREWPWRADVIAGMAPTRREEVGAALHADLPLMGRAAMDVLCECLLKAVQRGSLHLNAGDERARAGVQRPWFLPRRLFR